MKMRLSCFGYIKDLDTIAEAGYDLAELHNREIMELDEAGFKAAKKKLKDCGIPCEVFNNPVPLDKKIADPDFDLNFYRDYLTKGGDRVAEMGARFWVFGNGLTRSLPTEGNIEAAKEKLITFMNMLCDIAAERNITVLLEPLGTSKSNIVLSIPEALDFINMLGKPNLKTFVDVRWFAFQNRPYDEFLKYADQIYHVHLDNPLTDPAHRHVPRMDDGYDYSQLFDMLKKICYKGIISIEALEFSDFKREITETIGFFKEFGITPYRG